MLARLVGWALDTARNPPLVIVVEDLHWADPSTLELIQLLIKQGAMSGGNPWSVEPLVCDPSRVPAREQSDRELIEEAALPLLFRLLWCH